MKKKNILQNFLPFFRRNFSIKKLVICSKGNKYEKKKFIRLTILTTRILLGFDFQELSEKGFFSCLFEIHRKTLNLTLSAFKGVSSIEGSAFINKQVRLIFANGNILGTFKTLSNIFLFVLPEDIF